MGLVGAYERPHTRLLSRKKEDKLRNSGPFMSYGVVSPSRGYNQMLPPARKRGCLAENTAQPPTAAALGLVSSTRSLAYTCHP